MVEFQHFFTAFVMICNFSVADLYAKDYNYVNYAGLTLGFYYFSKQFESLMLKNFKLTSINRNPLIFNDEMPPEKTPG